MICLIPKQIQLFNKIETKNKRIKISPSPSSSTIIKIHNIFNEHTTNSTIHIYIHLLNLTVIITRGVISAKVAFGGGGGKIPSDIGGRG